ncbi:hypothetical protein V2A60_007288 [Cordyceps javanica]
MSPDEAPSSRFSVFFSEFEPFCSEGSFSDTADSVPFMDHLFGDVVDGSTTELAPSIPSVPPSTVSHESLEHFFVDSSPSSRHDSEAPMAEAEWILLDAQGRLLNLVRALSSCSSFPQDAEEIYRITDIFVKVVDDITTRLDESSAAHSPSGGSITHMLLSSCYMSLIQAFECLVNLLGRELGLKNSDSEPSLGCTLAENQLPRPTAAANVPYISVGSVRLAMPRRAVAEINLHLVGQAVQQLQASITRCAAKFQPGLGMDHKDLSAHALAGSSSVSALTNMAMSELAQRESAVFLGLQMSTRQQWSA